MSCHQHFPPDHPLRHHPWPPPTHSHSRQLSIVDLPGRHVRDRVLAEKIDTVIKKKMSGEKTIILAVDQARCPSTHTHTHTHTYGLFRNREVQCIRKFERDAYQHFCTSRHLHMLSTQRNQICTSLPQRCNTRGCVRPIRQTGMRSRKRQG